jgi:hypothetical protein
MSPSWSSLQGRLLFMAPTVMALAADAGDELHASASSFPAENAKVMTLLTALFTAVFSV